MRKVFPESSVKNRLIAETWYSGFEKAHDTYNAISAASDGKIYYILSSEAVDVGGKMYSFDPLDGTIKFLADLTEICGEKDTAAIVQGKSHVPFYEKEGELYFATHVGYYEMIDGMERLPVNPPPGIGSYPGGHFISYHLANGRFTDLGKIANGEGILTMTMDTTRSQLYAITWPEGHFIHLDLQQQKMRDLGLVSGKGEAGQPGKDYRVLCRSMFVEPASGQVYFTNAEGDIFFYDPVKKLIQKRTDVHMRLDYFGNYPTDQPGSMGYNWRQIIWHTGENAAYGVHGNSGYLFRFDPAGSHLELVERITSEPSRRSGMYDQFSYGYLGFTLDLDHNVIYYLTGGPVYENGALVRGQKKIAKGGAKGLENLHLVTYDLASFHYQDHGAVFYADGSRPTYVNSIALDKDGNIYTLARMNYEGKEIADLVRIRNPFG
jgi:hypothetical protein